MEERIIEYAKKNPKDYAEKANLANSCGKTLMLINGNLELRDREYSIEELKSRKLLEINNIYESKANLIKVETPESEILTWNIQKSEAEAWKKDNSAETPFIDGIALSRNIAKEELINKILQKSNSYNSYMSYLTGLRQYYEDRIKEALTINDINGVIWKD